jgi:hypothetical protein
VIDNVPEPEAGTAPPAITEFCPAVGSVSILATSRHDTREESVTSLSMDALELDSAVLLLTDNLQGAAAVSWDDWRRIAEWVGSLPIALDLLNRSLALNSIQPRDLLDRLTVNVLQLSATRELDELGQEIRNEVPENAVRGVTEVFSISFRKLDSTAQHVCQLLAHLAPEPIPEEFMQGLPGNSNSAAVRAALHARHFVTFGNGASFGVMHRLLADFLRSVSAHQTPQMLEQGCATLARIMTPERGDDPKHWPLMGLCRAHAELLLARSVSTELLYEGGPSLVGS